MQQENQDSSNNVSLRTSRMYSQKLKLAFDQDQKYLISRPHTYKDLIQVILERLSSILEKNNTPRNLQLLQKGLTEKDITVSYQLKKNEKDFVLLSEEMDYQIMLQKASNELATIHINILKQDSEVDQDAIDNSLIKKVYCDHHEVNQKQNDDDTNIINHPDELIKKDTQSTQQLVDDQIKKQSEHNTSQQTSYLLKDDFGSKFQQSLLNDQMMQTRNNSQNQIQSMMLDYIQTCLLNQDMDQFVDTVISCECQNGCDQCNDGKIVLTKQNIYIYKQMLMVSIQNLKGIDNKQQDVQKSIQIFDINQNKDKQFNLKLNDKVELQESEIMIFKANNSQHIEPSNQVEIKFPQKNEFVFENHNVNMNQNDEKNEQVVNKSVNEYQFEVVRQQMNMNSASNNQLDVMISIKNTGQKLIYISEHLECTMGMFKGKKEYMINDVENGNTYDFKFSCSIDNLVSLDKEISQWRMYSDTTKSYFGSPIQLNLEQLIKQHNMSANQNVQYQSHNSQYVYNNPVQQDQMFNNMPLQYQWSQQQQQQVQNGGRHEIKYDLEMLKQILQMDSLECEQFIQKNNLSDKSTEEIINFKFQME